MPNISEQLRDYIQWTFGLTISVALFLLSKNQFIAIYNKNPVRAIFVSILFVLTILRFFLYLKAVREELDLLKDIFDEQKINKVYGNPLLVGIILSVTMGVLLAYSTNILIYCMIIVPFSVMDLYGQTIVNYNIAQFILSEKMTTKFNKRYREILLDYYFKRPLLLRAAILLCFMCTALILSIIEFYTKINLYGLAAYIIVTISILIGEVIIMRWRSIRDKELSVAINNI